MRRALAVAGAQAVSALVFHGCLPTPRFACDADRDCRVGAAQGFCEANRVCSFAARCIVDSDCGAGGAQSFCKPDGTCSFADLSCADPARVYALYDDGQGVAGQCVRPVCADNPVAAFALGEGHSCLVRASGKVQCWGRNDFGQLGDGTTTPHSVPVDVVGLDGAVDVAVGLSHTCVRRGTGDIWCWGRGDEGQLGDGNRLPLRATPTPVLFAASAPAQHGAVFQQIAAGRSASCALTNHGRIFCWGGNRDGEIGDATIAGLTPLPVVVKRGDVRAAVPGGDGGTPADALPIVEPAVLDGVEAISMRESHVCALVSGGSVFCWGGNTSGQLGNREVGKSAGPAPVAGIDGTHAILDDAQSVVVGRRHSCALRAGGTAVCWGHNSTGQLGDDGVTTQRTPVAVKTIDRLVDLVAGGDHTCARRADGITWCWGDNEFGQLGDGTTTAAGLPVPVRDLGINSPDRLAAGGGHTCVRRKDLSLWCWGDDRQGQLGIGRMVARIDDGKPAAAVAGVTGVTSIAAGAEHTCALSAGHGVVCWGGGLYGRLGNGTQKDAAVARPTQPRLAAQVVIAGGLHSCAVDVSGNVTCWGRGVAGQLATGMFADVLTPTPIAALAGSTQIALGAEHGCAVRPGSTVSCWGKNASGRRGPAAGMTAAVATPAPVPDLAGVIEIAAGAAHSCACTLQGRVFCWGDNAQGQLARIDPAPSHAPVEVPLPAGATRIVSGADHSCTLLIDGRLYCWGRGDLGQLGNSPSPSSAPGLVIGLGGVTSVSAGGRHTCALTAAGTAHCFGANDHGQLGDGTTRTAFTAVVARAAGAAAIALAAGGAHTCEIRKDRSVACWGDNTSGQLGAGGELLETRPRALPLICR